MVANHRTSSTQFTVWVFQKKLIPSRYVFWVKNLFPFLGKPRNRFRLFLFLLSCATNRAIASTRDMTFITFHCKLFVVIRQGQGLEPMNNQNLPLLSSILARLYQMLKSDWSVLKFVACWSCLSCCLKCARASTLFTRLRNQPVIF